VQAAVAGRNAEAEQLIITISALREELETSDYVKDQSVQAAISDAHQEITQLKDTVSALRDQLESGNVKH